MLRMLVVAVCVAALTACGWGKGPKQRGRRDVRPFDQPGALRLLPGQVPEGSPKLPAELVDKPVRADLPDDQPGLVVLVVMDTVRADHTSLCAYHRPTTPTLEAMAVQPHTAHTCAAYAPATWTLPTHASLFTGQAPEDHGLLGRGIALPDEATTLAERFAERGYQTALVSANPILKAPTGLHQGFHHTEVAPGMISALRGPRGFAGALRGVLARLDATRPLFLVVNLYDAHDPYPPIPRDLGWVHPQPSMSFREQVKVPDPTYLAFRSGELAGEPRARWLRRLTDGYDHGILLADQGLTRVVKLLLKQGWSKHGVRMVVTSDHGENLGEHDRLRHDGPPFETVARVPVLVYDDTRPALQLPEPLSLVDLHDVVLDGRLPEVPGAVRSSSVDYGPGADAWFEDSVALWPATDRKWMSRPEARVQVDLAEDPGELQPAAAPPEAVDALTAAETRLQEAKVKAAAEARQSAEVGALLEELGYAE
ncbi:MAG: sulfatase-like hydrolase/transferase [Alphaproteobacteria bacterium]|nr:sulfatase-like hydrolase/transferase [Alphaproteobacteria bacterium]